MLASSDRDRLVVERLKREKRKRLARRSLVDFIPSVTPEFEAPHHLGPVLDLFQRAFDEGDVRGWSSVPPQHGKSESIFHAFVRALLRDPTKRHGYSTYSIEFAAEQQEKALKIAERALLPLERKSSGRWVTPQGGGVVWTGTGGRLTGKPIDGVFFVDDPIKGRLEAESPAYRRAAMDFIRGTALTRLHPGASVIINMTRWHEEDPVGVFRRDRGWEGVTLPAVNEEGEALWPERRPIDFLDRQREDVGEYDWWSLFMGEPRPRGDRVFSDVHTYDEIPQGAYRAAVGFDAAYTGKSHADWTVVLYGHMVNGVLYLTNMLRWQADAGVVVRQLVARGMKSLWWHRSGTEIGLQTFLESQGVHVNAIPAIGDKFARAQPAAAEWRAGRIAVPSPRAPEYGPWVDVLLDELYGFTGLGDKHDDVVDALAALHHALGHTPQIGMWRYAG